MPSQSQAYFKGKRQLLEWINEFLGVKVMKVEECATGAIYCQLLDAIFPGKVNVKKIDHKARHSWEYMKNWKIIQTLFRKESISKKIPVEKLVQGKFQDNLEFLQWFYHFFHRQSPNPPAYDTSRRQSFSNSHETKKPIKTRIPTSRKLIDASPVGKQRVKPTAKPPTRMVKRVGLNRTNRQKHGLEKKLKEAKAELAQKTAEYDELFKTASEMEKERDYYYEKMLAVDKCFESKPDSEVKREVLAILYDTDSEKLKGSPEKRSSLAVISSQPPTQSQPQPKQNSNSISKKLQGPSTPQNTPTLSSTTTSQQPLPILPQNENPDSTFELDEPMAGPHVPPTATQSRVRLELGRQDFGETYDPDSSGLFDMSAEGRRDLVDDLNMTI